MVAIKVIIILIKVIRVLIIKEIPNNDSINPLDLEIPARCPAGDSLSHG